MIADKRCIILLEYVYNMIYFQLLGTFILDNEKLNNLQTDWLIALPASVMTITTGHNNQAAVGALAPLLHKALFKSL